MLSPSAEHPALAATLDALPAGDLLALNLPAALAGRFAVFHDRAASQCTVLVPRDLIGSRSMYALRQQLLDADLPAPHFVPATPELIQLVTARQGRDRAGRGDRQESASEQLARELIDAALAARASDLHIETRGDHATVHFRIDGRRRLHRHIGREAAHALGVVLYAVQADAGSKDVIWDPQQVLDGVIEHRSDDGAAVQLRFSSAPIFPSGNFHIVLRLLRLDSGAPSLPELGYTSRQLDELQALTSGLSGLVLMCGPTNSGKSTTLQAMLRSLHAAHGDGIKILTVEDPVEYLVPGACQISVARRRGSSVSPFAAALRGLLRQDPDVVMIGEVRDRESAEVARDLVLSGRKVLTTLHTYSAPWAFVRLRELGLPLELLTMPGFVSGIVYQRLVPRLCAHCAVPLGSATYGALAGGLRRRLHRALAGQLDHVRLRGPGCPHCGGQGVTGRVVCAEMLLPDPMLLELLAQQRHTQVMSHWREREAQHEGLPTALAHALARLVQGEVDPRDVESQVGLLDAELPA